MSRPRDHLISPKHISEYSEQEYYDYVTDMYWVDRSREAPAPGLSLRRVKSGKLSVSFARAKRAFEYVTEDEILRLSERYGYEPQEVREAFTARQFIIAKDRPDAERKRTCQKK